MNEFSSSIDLDGSQGRFIGLKGGLWGVKGLTLGRILWNLIISRVEELKIPPYRFVYAEIHGRNEKVTGLKNTMCYDEKYEIMNKSKTDVFKAILRRSKVPCLKPPKLVPDPKNKEDRRNDVLYFFAKGGIRGPRCILIYSPNREKPWKPIETTRNL